MAAAQWLSVGLLVLDGSCNEGKIIKKIVSLIKSAIKSKSEDEIDKLKEAIKEDNISIQVLKKISDIIEAAQNESGQASSKDVDSSDVTIDFLQQPSQLSIVKQLFDKEIKQAKKREEEKKLELNLLEAGARLCGSHITLLILKSFVIIKLLK